MKKIAIVTDSNSGFTEEEAKALGCFVVPMPIIVDGEIYFDMQMTQDEFFNTQASKRITTSQPNGEEIADHWRELLKEYDEIVYIPMSSELSKSCESAMAYAQDFEGKVQVVDNRRISFTMKASVCDAVRMANDGKSAKQIKQFLEESALDASIYLMVDTLKYLKQGGRITTAAAMIATILNIKPVLQIQGGKLDSYAKVINVKMAKSKMIEAVKKDIETRFRTFAEEGKLRLSVAHTRNEENAYLFAEEIKKHFPNVEFEYVDPLPFSIATHTGPKVLAVGVYRIY